MSGLFTSPDTAISQMRGQGEEEKMTDIHEEKKDTRESKKKKKKKKTKITRSKSRRDYIKENVARMGGANPILRQKSRVHDHWDDDMLSKLYPAKEEEEEEEGEDAPPPVRLEKKQIRWGKVRGIVHQALGPYLSKQKKKFDNARDTVNSIAKDKGIILEVEAGMDTKHIPVRSQGNLEFYTHENLLKRQNARHAPETVAVLEEWWRTIEGLKDERGYLLQTEFVAIAVKIQKALDEKYDGDKAIAFAESDWEHDSKGKGYIDKETFFESVFEIADLWTDTVHERDYVNMLRALLCAISVEMQRGRIRLRRTKDIVPLKKTIDADGRPRWHVRGVGGADVSRNATDWHGRNPKVLEEGLSGPSPDWVRRLSLARPSSLRPATSRKQPLGHRIVAPTGLVRIDSNVIPGGLCYRPSHPNDPAWHRYLLQQEELRRKEEEELRRRRARNRNPDGGIARPRSRTTDDETRWMPWDLSRLNYTRKKDERSFDDKKKSPATWKVNRRRRKSSGETMEENSEHESSPSSSSSLPSPLAPMRPPGLGMTTSLPPGVYNRTSTKTATTAPQTKTNDPWRLPKLKGKLRRLSRLAAHASALRRRKSIESESVLSAVGELESVPSPRTLAKTGASLESFSSSRRHFGKLRRLSIGAAKKSAQRRRRTSMADSPGIDNAVLRNASSPRKARLDPIEHGQRAKIMRGAL